MKNKIKLATIVLVMLACAFLAGGSPRAIAADNPDPFNAPDTKHAVCGAGQQRLCVIVGDGGPLVCWCQELPK